MTRTGKIGWNVQLLKGISKAAFVRRFEKIYPDVDLKAEYDRIFPPKPKKPRISGLSGQEATE